MSSRFRFSTIALAAAVALTACGDKPKTDAPADAPADAQTPPAAGPRPTRQPPPSPRRSTST